MDFKGDIYNHFGEKVSKTLREVSLLKEKITKLLKKNPIIPKGAIPFEIDYRDIKGSTYKSFNAFTQSTDPHFTDRVVFPISDINDNVIGFIGRFLHSNANPKYKVVPSKTKLPLYPQKISHIHNSIIIVEGIFDMLNLHDKGLYNTVTGFGISRGQLPSWKHARRRKDKIEQVKEEFSVYALQGIDKIYVMYDGDEPGQEAAKGLVEALDGQFVVENIEISKGEDPGEFTAERVDALRKLLYENSSSGQMSQQH